MLVSLLVVLAEGLILWWSGGKRDGRYGPGCWGLDSALEVDV